MPYMSYAALDVCLTRGTLSDQKQTLRVFRALDGPLTVPRFGVGFMRVKRYI